MIKIKQAVIVEGKYDKIKLSTILDTLIIETNGFDIFSDKQRMELIRSVAKLRGIIIMTDSDAAGFMIRNHIGGNLPKNQVTHVYVPEILGKEKRKAEPSKEGKLGVEGIPKKLLIESLKRAGIKFEDDQIQSNDGDGSIKAITKMDLYNDNLSGTPGSKQRLEQFKKIVKLPAHISKNALVDVLNVIMTYDEYKAAVQRLNDN